jgi:hypothetical protein
VTDQVSDLPIQWARGCLCCHSFFFTDTIERAQLVATVGQNSSAAVLLTQQQQSRYTTLLVVLEQQLASLRLASESAYNLAARVFYQLFSGPQSFGSLLASVTLVKHSVEDAMQQLPSVIRSIQALGSACALPSDCFAPGSSHHLRNCSSLALPRSANDTACCGCLQSNWCVYNHTLSQYYPYEYKFACVAEDPIRQVAEATQSVQQYVRYFVLLFLLSPFFHPPSPSDMCVPFW